MTGDRDLNQLRTELTELEGAIRGARVAEQRTSFAIRLIAFGVVGMLLGFILFNFVQFRTEWTPEKLGPRLEQELAELNPLLASELHELARHLIPVYAREGRRQFRSMGPQISRVLEEQLNRLAADLREDVYLRLSDNDAEIRKRTTEMIFEAHPDLQSESEFDEIRRHFRIVTEDALMTALSDFDTRFSRQADRLQETIFDFSVEDTGESTIELQKRFIHLWLQLLDREIMKL